MTTSDRYPESPAFHYDPPTEHDPFDPPQPPENRPDYDPDYDPPPITEADCPDDMSPERTRLDILESSLHEYTFGRENDPDQELLGIAFRHSGWRHRRRQTFEAMLDLGLPPARVSRFAACGSHAWVQRSAEPPHKYRIVANRCRDRWCEACQREHRNKIALNLMARLPDRPIRFLTLTLRSVNRPLREQIPRLYRCFAAFRRHKTIAAAMRGGITFLELTRSKVTGLWHPHLHILFEGAYLPKELARHRWHHVTGDSYIIDLRILHGPRTAAAYVAKYAAAAVPGTLPRDSREFREVMDALEQVRIFNTFGTWKGLKLSQSDPPSEVWEYLAPLAEFVEKARAGDRDATLILAKILNTAENAAAAAHAYGEPPS